LERELAEAKQEFAAMKWLKDENMRHCESARRIF
jgi:hypothetical protein